MFYAACRELTALLFTSIIICMRIWLETENCAYQQVAAKMVQMLIQGKRKGQQCLTTLQINDIFHLENAYHFPFEDHVVITEELILKGQLIVHLNPDVSQTAQSVTWYKIIL